jgi:uncharacterized cupredoxin-like copper-binding protein
MISVLAAGALTLVACGGDDDGGGETSATTGAGATEDGLVVQALDIRFDQEQYDAGAGELTIQYVSEGAQTHSLVVVDESNSQIGDRLAVDPGDTAVGTYEVEAGTYSLICDIPGHQEAGMVATLNVS